MSLMVLHPVPKGAVLCHVTEIFWENAFKKFFPDDFNAFDNYLLGFAMLTDLLPLFDVLWLKHVDGSVKYCNNSNALAMEYLQSCAKSSM